MKLIVIGRWQIKLQQSRSAPQIDTDAKFKVCASQIKSRRSSGYAPIWLKFSAGKFCRPFAIYSGLFDCHRNWLRIDSDLPPRITPFPR
jgi:hypothetical protein